MLAQKFLWLSMTPFASPVVPEVYIIAAMSSGSGLEIVPSQVYAPSPVRSMVKSSVATMIFILSRSGSGIREKNFLDTNRAFDSEWVRMFVISFSVSSVSIGTAILPEETTDMKDMAQFGMFWEKMATLSLAFMPKFESSLARIPHFSCTSAYVSTEPPPPYSEYAGRREYLDVEYSNTSASVRNECFISASYIFRDACLRGASVRTCPGSCACRRGRHP